MTIDMTYCGVVYNSLVLGCVRAVTLGWSRAIGFMPAFIFRLFGSVWGFCRIWCSLFIEACPLARGSLF